VSLRRHLAQNTHCLLYLQVAPLHREYITKILIIEHTEGIGLILGMPWTGNEFFVSEIVLSATPLRETFTVISARKRAIGLDLPQLHWYNVSDLLNTWPYSLGS
jgi:hypothetical protein